MIGGLDENGNFFVARKEGKVDLVCPYQGKKCGTWCAQFSEPMVNKKENNTSTLVHICQGRYWKLSKFIDQRPDNLAQDVLAHGL